MKKILLSCVLLFSLGQAMDSPYGVVMDFVEQLKKDGPTGIGSQPKVFSAERIWLRCSSCHGEFGEELPMHGNFKLSEMTEDDIVKKMIFYKNLDDKSGSMQAFMRAQMMDVDTEKIPELAKYIKSLKK